MKKNNFFVMLKIFFLLIVIGGLTSIAQDPNTYFLGTKIALADDWCWLSDYDIPAPINDPYTYADQSIPINDPYTYTPEYQDYTADWSWLSDYDIPAPINDPYTYADQSIPINDPYTYTPEYSYQGGGGSGGGEYYGGDTDTGATVNTDAPQLYLSQGHYAYPGNDGNYYKVLTDDSGNGQWVQVGPAELSNAGYNNAGAAYQVGGSGPSGENMTVMGTNPDAGGAPVLKDNTTGQYYYMQDGQMKSMGENMAINPISGSSFSPDQFGTSGGAGSGQSGIGFAVGTKDGQAVYQNGTTGELYTVGNDGYKRTMDANTAFTQLTPDQAEKLASGQFQIGQGGVTSYTPAQIVPGPDGRLYQMAGGQMVPYTGSAASGGYVGSGGGIFGALGSAVGSVVGGVSSAIGSVIGGVGSFVGSALGLGGNTGYYGTPSYGGIGGYSSPSGSYGATGGYSVPSGYYGATGGYSSPSGYYGATGGYSAIPTAASTAGGWNPARYTNTGLPAASIYSVIQNLVMWALSIFGFFGIIGFVISGVWYLLAAGDDTLMKRAKNGMLYSIIGVVVGLIGLVIIFAVNSLLKGSWYF